jgi:hypothetical protein
MSHHHSFAAIVGSLFLATPAAAQSSDPSVSLFGEIGPSRVECDSDPDVGFDAVHARAGAQFNRYLGVEVEGGIGLGNDTVNIGGFDVDAELKHSIAGFAVLSLPIGRDVEILARGGFAVVRVSADAGFGSVSDSEEGFAGGVGLRFFPSGGNNGFRIDYTRYEIGDGSANAFQASYVRRF